MVEDMVEMTSIILVKWVFHWLRSVSFCRKITFDFFLMDACLGNGRSWGYETLEVERYKREAVSYMTTPYTWLYIIYNDTKLGQTYDMRLLFATIVWFQWTGLITIRLKKLDHDFGAETPIRKLLNLPWNSWRPMMIGSFQEINLNHQGDRSDLSPWRTTLPRNLRHVSWQHERLVEGSWRQSIGPPRTWSKHKKGEWKSQWVELFLGEVFFPGKVEAYMSWIYEECTPRPSFSSRCSGTCLCVYLDHTWPLFCEQVCPSF